MRLIHSLLCLAFTATLFGQSTPAKPRVKLVTSYGSITLELEPAAAPKTVENFLAYVKSGFYAGTIFHRVIPSFMIQGGGFTEDMQEKATQSPVINEAEKAASAGLLNTRGTISMARTDDPDSASSQFFINTVDNPRLNFQSRTQQGYGYCAFGRVIEGMDVVTKIEKVITVTRRGLPNVPEFPIRIKSAEVLPVNP
jgi:cyclophilin family peptidyl-prolyl cis-trans isomerase